MTQQNQPPSTQEKPVALKRTPLYQTHLSLGARMVPFAGWEMPVQYSSILAEARAVRSSAGIFDASHMGRVEIKGRDAGLFLHRLTTADVLGMSPGRARYALVCNESGGILDDTILCRLEEERFLLVPNASNAGQVWDWLNQCNRQWHMQVDFHNIIQETAVIALQGPKSEEILQPISYLDLSSLKPFRCTEGQVSGVPVILSRTGYTGEEGFELTFPADNAPFLWHGLQEAGAIPCGLGSRDVLRVEAGFLLHGSDMDSSVTPLEAGLERFVGWAKDDFVGLPALQGLRKKGVSRTLAGFRLLEKGIPRHGYPIMVAGKPVGTVTSGTHSPTLDMDIGLGYVALESSRPGTRIAIDIRGRRVEAEVVPLPFYSRRK